MLLLFSCYCHDTPTPDVFTDVLPRFHHDALPVFVSSSHRLRSAMPSLPASISSISLHAFNWHRLFRSTLLVRTGGLPCSLVILVRDTRIQGYGPVACPWTLGSKAEGDERRRDPNPPDRHPRARHELGRASCGERVCQYV